MEEEQPPLNISPSDWAATPVAVRLTLLDVCELVRELTARVRDLEARVQQNSHNSSNPPSSDPPSAPAKPEKVARGRPRGGQKGHAAQQRALVPVEQVEHIVALYPDCCPDCATPLSASLADAAPVRRSQVWEVPPIAAEITEYQQHTLCCPHCQELVEAPLPADAPPGAFGPRLTALVGLLRGRYRLSVRESAALLKTLTGIEVSTGSVSGCCRRLSDALEAVDQEIVQHVRKQATLNVDETSWSQAAQPHWLWMATSDTASCFRIQAGRNQASAKRLLGVDYGGVVTSDRAGAYTWLGVRHRQLCWAHLERNLQALVEYGHPESTTAKALLGQVAGIWAAWKGYQVGLFDQVALQQALLPIRLALQEQLWRSKDSGWTKLRQFSREMLKWWDALWTFRAVEGVEPTNNRAERAVRPAVLWRKGCFGTQSEWGSRFAERLLSVAATGQKQRQDLWAFLTQTLQAAWAKQPLPTLF